MVNDSLDMDQNWKNKFNVYSVRNSMQVSGDHNTSAVMKLVSLNVGTPRKVNLKNRTITTGIFKEPVQGRIMLRRLNLDGDKQADLSVHGGVDKAVYVYPKEHYEYWRQKFPNMKLPWGMFGENFTTEGLLEDTARIGDRFRVGNTEVKITQPRLPCYKLGIKFGRADMIKRFLSSGRTGFYLAVLKEGMVGAGDAIELTGRNANAATVAEIVKLYK